jgi:hypothetical protein
MALKGEAKRTYMKRYMARRRLEDKAFVWEAQLREERRRMKKAVHRVKMAEKWMSEHPEAPPNECLLSLAFHWNAIVAEEQAKAKTSKLKRGDRVVKSCPPIGKAVRGLCRDAFAVARAVRGPLAFESVP